MPRIFSIAFVPEGNILLHVAAASRIAFAAGDPSAFRGLPEAIHLGFFTRGTEGGAAGFAKALRRSGRSLFEGLPDSLSFSACERIGGKWYLVPRPPLGEAPVRTAEVLARSAGFLPAVLRPFEPGAGFFCANRVTPAGFAAFTFRHFDAVLYGIDSADGEFDKVAWRALARISRWTGPSSPGRRLVL